jgi:hypothetical protein
MNWTKSYKVGTFAVLTAMTHGHSLDSPGEKAGDKR